MSKNTKYVNIVEAIRAELTNQINQELEKSIEKALKIFEQNIRMKAVDIGLKAIDLLYEARTQNNILQITILTKP